MSYCEKCGSKSEPHANFCQDCGHALAGTTKKTYLDANIKVATTSVTTEKAFNAVANTFSFILDLLKKLIKPVIILSILAVIIFGLVFGGFMFYENYLKKEKEKTAQKIEKAIKYAQNDTPSKYENWEIIGELDPASGKNIARQAFIDSSDELCSLAVEKRIDGDNLTSIFCYKFNIYSRSDISIKFDTDEKLYTMDIMKFTNSEDIYISSDQITTRQNSYDNMNKEYFPYDKFIKGLLTANTLAVKINPIFKHDYDSFENPFSSKYNREDITLKPLWLKFPLKNARSAISRLGKVTPISKDEAISK